MAASRPSEIAFRRILRGLQNMQDDMIALKEERAIALQVTSADARRFRKIGIIEEGIVPILNKLKRLEEDKALNYDARCEAAIRLLEAALINVSGNSELTSKVTAITHKAKETIGAQQKSAEAAALSDKHLEYYFGNAYEALKDFTTKDNALCVDSKKLLGNVPYGELGLYRELKKVIKQIQSLSEHKEEKLTFSDVTNITHCLDQVYQKLVTERPADEHSKVIKDKLDWAREQCARGAEIITLRILPGALEEKFRSDFRLRGVGDPNNSKAYKFTGAILACVRYRKAYEKSHTKEGKIKTPSPFASKVIDEICALGRSMGEKYLLLTEKNEHKETDAYMQEMCDRITAIHSNANDHHRNFITSGLGLSLTQSRLMKNITDNLLIHFTEAQREVSKNKLKDKHPNLGAGAGAGPGPARG